MTTSIVSFYEGLWLVQVSSPSIYESWFPTKIGNRVVPELTNLMGMWRISTISYQTLEAPIPQNVQTHSNNSSNLSTNFLSVFDHFVILALKGLRTVRNMWSSVRGTFITQSEMELFSKILNVSTVNYFREKLHLRCLIVFWMLLWTWQETVGVVFLSLVYL